MSVANIDLDVFKDIPGYKGILKAVLKFQIQQLVGIRAHEYEYMFLTLVWPWYVNHQNQPID